MTSANPTIIVHQTRSGSKKDIFPNFCLLERDKGSISGTW